jgi:hypothetical protein
VTSNGSKNKLHEAKNLMLNASLGVNLREVRTRRAEKKFGEEGRVNRSKGSNRSNPLTRSAMPDRSGRDELNAKDSWEAVRNDEKAGDQERGRGWNLNRSSSSNVITIRSWEFSPSHFIKSVERKEM